MPKDVDPRAVVDEADRLPDDWREAFWTDHVALGTPNSREPFIRDLACSMDVIHDAFRLAGWRTDETRALLSGVHVFPQLQQAAWTAWEFRRYGFAASETRAWSQACGNPAIAHVYKKMGKGPTATQRIRTWLNTHVDRADHADVQAAILCYGIGRARAQTYVRAGLSHHEIHYWELQRRRLETAEKAQQDDSVAVMAGLRD